MQNFHELIQGFHNFKEDYFLREREFFSSLVHGQSPKTLVVACCDSRVDPAILMGCRPGDLFVARSIAAIVPDVEKAGEHDAVVSAVEYAVKPLAVAGSASPIPSSKNSSMRIPTNPPTSAHDAVRKAPYCSPSTACSPTTGSSPASMQARSHSTPSTTTLPAVPCTSGMPKRRTSRQPSSPSSEQTAQTFPRPALAPRILSD